MNEKYDSTECEEHILKFLKESRNKPITDASHAVKIMTSDILQSFIANILENENIKSETMDGVIVLNLAKMCLQKYMDFIDSELKDTEYNYADETSSSCSL